MCHCFRGEGTPVEQSRAKSLDHCAEPATTRHQAVHSIQAELQLTLNIYPPPDSVFQLYIYRRRTGEICRGHNSFESSGIYFIVHFWNINLISCRTFYFILFYFQALQSRTNAGYFLRIFGIFQILSLFQFSQIKRVFSHED